VLPRFAPFRHSGDRLQRREIRCNKGLTQWKTQLQIAKFHPSFDKPLTFAAGRGYHKKSIITFLV
jgi:hypothetical protein